VLVEEADDRGQGGGHGQQQSDRDARRQGRTRLQPHSKYA